MVIPRPARHKSRKLAKGDSKSTEQVNENEDLTGRWMTGTYLPVIHLPVSALAVVQKAPLPTVRFFGRMSRFRRSAAAGTDILLAKPSVLFGRRLFPVSASFGSRLIEEPLQEGPAPAAAGPRTKTLAQLSHAADLFHTDKVHHLPLADPETEADFVVKIHGYPTPS